MDKYKRDLSANLAYGIFTGLALLIMLMYWQTAAPRAFTSTAGFVLAVGDICGILGAYLLLIQVLFQARITLIEDALGMAEAMRLHHWNGYAVLTLILVHPTLVTISYAMTFKADLIQEFLKLVLTFEDVWKSFLAVVILVSIVLSSMAIVKLKLRYEFWYWVHFCAYAAILLAFSHQLSVGSDFVNHPFFTAFWWAMYLSVAGLILYYRFTKPVLKSVLHNLKVESIVPETDDTYSLYISGRNLDKLSFRAGQFGIWRFIQPTLILENHPFSLSHEPDGKHLRLTFKKLGDFTAKLAQVPVGTRVIFDGPHGDFVPQDYDSKRLYIAGGIGVTPLRTMIGAQTNIDGVLLYAARTDTDIAFATEWPLLQTQKGLAVHYFFNVAASPKGRFGQITSAAILELVPDVAERQIFVCGPPPMMNAMRSELAKLGVKPEAIHSERFAY